MKTKILYKILLLSSLLFGACVQDDINDDPVGNDGNEEKKDVVLIRMGTDDAEVKDITSRLFSNIPASWEIGKKTIVDYDKMADPETEFTTDIKNPDIYTTVILNVNDVISGKYPVSLFRMLKFYKRDFYIVATGTTQEQKSEMLSLIGVYMESGYYGINYDNVQHYRIFPSADPYAKDNMIGKGVESFNRRLLARSVDNQPKGIKPDPGYNAQMADKEALKRIEIYNRIYGYTQGEGDVNYSMQAVPYKMREGTGPDVIIDNVWAIDAYNFQIYSKNNNCILSVTNTGGNGFTANIKDYTTPKGANVYAYIWNMMRESFSEVTIHSDGGIFREISYQPQTVNHGADYTENSFWKVSVEVSPTKLAEEPWEALEVSFSKESSTDVSYKTLSMDYSCKGQFGNGVYSKLWQFIPGEFYDRAEAFVYETSEGKRWIDAAQAMTPNYVTWGGYTLRQNYLSHINNSMKLQQQQCIYSLSSDAQPGVVSVAITDAIDLQKTYVHYNCGIRYGHDSVKTDLKMSKMVWIDFRQWDN
ncbi:hypothetical protein [Bacteroides nordii]|uniref:hypothetical protein n=1 Tax=Bacteroides nordii TaxID=291645 RepID=UPI00399AF44F